MPEDGIVCLDNGMYKIWFARDYRTHVANTLLLDNALATMGAGLPSAIAAKLLNTRRRVMAVCGDGGFMMNSQELETAVRLELDLVREKSAHPKPPMKSSRAFAVASSFTASACRSGSRAAAALSSSVAHRPWQFQGGSGLIS
jgi:hypothetical protein